MMILVYDSTSTVVLRQAPPASALSAAAPRDDRGERDSRLFQSTPIMTLEAFMIA
jgi:hypothetical protein